MKVEVHQFDSDLHHEIKEFNKEFNDWVEEERNKAEIAASTDSGFLQDSVKNADITSLSKDALQLYITKAKKNYSYDSEELRSDLIYKNLLEKDSKTNDFRPTGNCILLFGKNPRDKFPQASVKAKVNYGTGEPDAESFDDAMVLIPDKVEQWLKKVIPESMDRSGFSREKVSHYPPEVIREAIINALIHRDYTIKGAKINLDITPDRIEVRSPGEPFSPNTIKELQNFTAVSFTRNADLAYIFNQMGYMEESGVGMDTFKSLREKYDLPLPVIKYKKPHIIITFPRTIDASRNLDQKLKQLNDEELKGYEYVKVQGSVSKAEYAQHFGYPDKKAQRHIAKLKDLELVFPDGKGPNTKYVIGNDNV